VTLDPHGSARGASASVGACVCAARRARTVLVSAGRKVSVGFDTDLDHTLGSGIVRTLWRRPGIASMTHTEATTSGAHWRARLHAVVMVRPGEWPGLIAGFAYFFCLLCSYYILRPVRDEMGVRSGVDEMQWR